MEYVAKVLKGTKAQSYPNGADRETIFAAGDIIHTSPAVFRSPSLLVTARGWLRRSAL